MGERALQASAHLLAGGGGRSETDASGPVAGDRRKSKRVSAQQIAGFLPGRAEAAGLVGMLLVFIPGPVPNCCRTGRSCFQDLCRIVAGLVGVVSRICAEGYVGDWYGYGVRG